MDTYKYLFKQVDLKPSFTSLHVEYLKPCNSQVEDTNTLVSELLKVTAKEQGLLEQCKDFLTTLAAMQVNLANLLIFLFCKLIILHLFFVILWMINLSNLLTGQGL